MSAFTRSCRGPSSCISGTFLPLPTDTRLGVLGSFQRTGPILLESQLCLGWQCDRLSASASSFVKWALRIHLPEGGPRLGRAPSALAMRIPYCVPDMSVRSGGGYFGPIPEGEHPQVGFEPHPYPCQPWSLCHHVL